MEIEIKHSKPEILQAKIAKRKRLEEKFRDGPSTSHVMSSVVLFLVTCSQFYLYLFLILNGNKLLYLFFSILPLVIIFISYKNIQYAIYGRGANKTLVFILSVISICGSIVWAILTLPAVFHIPFSFISNLI